MTELKKLSSECEFDNIQGSLIKDTIVCDTRDNCLCEKLLRECDFTLSRAISVGYAAEETRLSLLLTLIRYLKRNSTNLAITLTTRTQESLWKGVNFAIVHNPEANAQLMESLSCLQ